jgi:type II secretory pathway component PulF
MLQLFPLLNKALRSLALARLCAALEGLLSAGVNILEAWPLAAYSSGSPALRRRVLSWKPDLDSGRTPAEMVQESSIFPTLFVSLYTTGELSGQLDETLHRLYVHYQEESSRQLKTLSQWLPRLLYFVVLISVGYQIVSFWASYYSGIMNQF